LDCSDFTKELLSETSSSEETGTSGSTACLNCSMVSDGRFCGFFGGANF
jgi:hypothetical protein